jgi:hypothetical protein
VAQLDADGHTVYEADSSTEVVTKLSARAIDVLLLRPLDRPADGPALWRCVRASMSAFIRRSRSSRSASGAGTVLVNKWGQGWSLTTPAVAPTAATQETLCPLDTGERTSELF